MKTGRLFSRFFKSHRFVRFQPIILSKQRVSVTFLWGLLVKISAKGTSCRTTAKEKKPSQSRHIFTPIWNGGFDFRAAVSLHLHKPMTTCRDTATDGRLFCRVYFTILFLLWSAPVKKSSYPPSGYSGHWYEHRNHVNRFYNSSASVCVLQTGAFCHFLRFCVGCRSPPVPISHRATMKQEVQRMDSS